MNGQIDGRKYAGQADFSLPFNCVTLDTINRSLYQSACTFMCRYAMVLMDRYANTEADYKNGALVDWDEYVIHPEKPHQ